MKIKYQGNKKISAHTGVFSINTDQPAEAGGEGTAPSPFELFLASLGTCAGIYAVGFMQSRNIQPEGFGIDMSFESGSSSGLISRIIMSVKLPEAFPAQYRDSIIRAMGLCTVKKHLSENIKIETVIV